MDLPDAVYPLFLTGSTVECTDEGFSRTRSFTMNETHELIF